MNATDRSARLAQLLEQLARVEEELKAISLRDADALDEHRHTIGRLEADIVRFYREWQGADE